MLALKKVSLIIIATLVLLLGYTVIHQVSAGSPVISLNSPVSFPVDI